MADVAASSPAALAADRLRTLLGANTAFQTWTGHAGDAASAKAHVHLYMLDAEEIDALEWPWVQIWEPDQPADDIPVAVQTFVTPVRLLVRIGQEVTAAYQNDGRNAGVEAANDLGTIAAILRAVNGGEVSDVRFVHNGVEQVEQPTFERLEGAAGADRWERYSYTLGLTLSPKGAD